MTHPEINFSWVSFFKYKWDAENAENADVLLLISENQRFLRPN